MVACFRFYDHDLPEFPFAIDWYDGAVHAAEYKRRHGMEDEEHEAWLAACKGIIAKVTSASSEDIYIKERQRKMGRQGQYEKLSEEKIERIVPENDLSFIVNLTDYLDTGLFLDHRITRSLFRQEASGKNVLNLFCYTGAFSVYAAKGNAKTVISVDMSRTYIHWAKRNMQFNKLYSSDKHTFIQDDVLAWLPSVQEHTFDLIICDPPTFSNSKRMEAEFDVQRDHVALLRKLLKITTDHGKIFFSNNYKGFELEKEKIPAFSIKDITAQTIPFDFQNRLHRACFLIEK